MRLFRHRHLLRTQGAGLSPLNSRDKGAHLTIRPLRVAKLATRLTPR